MSARRPEVPETPLDRVTFGALVILATELKADALEDFQGLLAPETPPRSRRRFVRAFFAAVEGMTWTLRRLALSRHYEGAVAFSPGEVAALREESYRIEGAHVATLPLRTPLRASVCFSFATFARAHQVTETPLDKDPEWVDFLSAIEIRDRLTHPKDLASLTVSDEEGKALAVAFEWFWRRTINLLNTARDIRGSDWIE